MSGHGGERKTLTVELRVEGGMLRRKIRGEYLDESSDGPRLDAAGDGYRVDAQHGVAAIRRVLWAGDRDTITAHLHGSKVVSAGEALFEVLFGVKATEGLGFVRKLFGHDTDAPTRHPVRVRIVTEVAELLSLPWGIMAWRQHFLRDSGWTFEVTDERDAKGELRLKLPTSLLLILPRLHLAGDDLETHQHKEAMADLVERHFRGCSTRPDRFAVATTREETVRLLRTMKPSMVYYYGHGSGGSSPGLHVPPGEGYQADSEKLWAARDIALAFQSSEAPVQIAYLNGCMTGEGGWGSLGQHLLRAVPVVLAHPTSTFAFGARETAIRWLDRVLGHEDEPVRAAFHREADAPVSGLGWLSPLVLARHAGFRVDRDQVDFRQLIEGIDLDRIKQRKEAFADVRELAVRKERRMQGFVAYGEPQNHHEDVPEQLIRYMDRFDPKLELHVSDPVRVTKGLRHGDGGAVSRSGEVSGYLKLALGGDWKDDLRKLLEKKAPPRTGKRHRILWLDWGVLRGRSAVDDVRRWLGFCSNHLMVHLPEGVDVVVSLAIEAPRADLEALRDELDELTNRPEHRTDQVRFTVLEALGKVPRGEILQHLDDAGCPQGIRDRLAQELHQLTGGAYHELRAWADKAGPGLWMDLLEELREQQKKDPPKR